MGPCMHIGLSVHPLNHLWAKPRFPHHLKQVLGSAADLPPKGGEVCHCHGCGLNYLTIQHTSYLETNQTGIQIHSPALDVGAQLQVALRAKRVVFGWAWVPRCCWVLPKGLSWSLEKMEPQMQWYAASEVYTYMDPVMTYTSSIWLSSSLPKSPNWTQVHQHLSADIRLT